VKKAKTYIINNCSFSEEQKSPL